MKTIWTVTYRTRSGRVINARTWGATQMDALVDFHRYFDTAKLSFVDVRQGWAGEN